MHDPSEPPPETRDVSGPAGSQERPPSCRDLVGLLAQNDRRSAYAALVLGATTVEQVVERTGLRPAATAMALQKLAEGGIARHDPAEGTYVLLDDTFRLAVREEVRLTGRGRGDGAGAYFRKGRLTSIPGNAQVRNRVLSVVAGSFEKGVTYPEPKVNAICGAWLDDWVSLRVRWSTRGCCAGTPPPSTRGPDRGRRREPSSASVNRTTRVAGAQIVVSVGEFSTTFLR